MKHKTCLLCQTSIHGRADKKFCDSYCRAQYHNEKRKDELLTMRRVDRILKKNRRILRILKQDKMPVISRFQLEEMGYVFNYFTHLIESDKGAHYFCCYDHGLLSIAEDKLAIVTSLDSALQFKPE